MYRHEIYFVIHNILYANGLTHSNIVVKKTNNCDVYKILQFLT